MKKTIKMAEVISSDIRSRKNADLIKAIIAPGDDVTLDFLGVTFISRSFADEICNIIDYSDATISKCNMCPFVQNMLNVVASGRSKKRVFAVDNDDDIYVCKDMESLSRILLA
jgi:hypothetical protein